MTAVTNIRLYLRHISSHLASTDPEVYTWKKCRYEVVATVYIGDYRVIGNYYIGKFFWGINVKMIEQR